MRQETRDAIESKREIEKPDAKQNNKEAPVTEDENESDIRNLLTSIDISGSPQYEDDYIII